MRNFRKILFIISCISACIALLNIVNTYARYVSSATGTADISIAKWNITVNDLTVKNNTDLSSVIEPIFPGNDNINPNIIAPTSEGYFELNLDYTEVDVSFDYEISISPNENSPVTDIVISKYAIDDGTPIEMNGNTSIKETILNSDTTRAKKVTVYIIWDDENGTMDNAADTTATIPENSAALLDVSIKFTQNATV